MSIAAAGLWSVPALAASSTDGEPEKAACTEPAPTRSPLAGLGLGSSPDEASARQACNSQKSHVDRSGLEPAEGADDTEADDAGADDAGADDRGADDRGADDTGADNTGAGNGAAVTDETEPAAGTGATRGTGTAGGAEPAGDTGAAGRSPGAAGR
ncbi:MAG: hypothetical protein AB7V44_01795 [Pseudonocardia sp.]